MKKLIALLVSASVLASTVVLADDATQQAVTGQSDAVTQPANDQAKKVKKHRHHAKKHVKHHAKKADVAAASTTDATATDATAPAAN